MSESKELTRLLKNLQAGIKNVGVKGVNNALEEIGRKENQGTVLVIQTVAKHYGLSQKALLKSRKRGEVTDARQIAMCILHFENGLSFREIAAIFECWLATVATAIKRFKSLNLKIVTDVGFKEKYELIKTKVTDASNL